MDSSAAASNRWMGRLATTLAMAGLLIVALCLRLAASSHDLWLDEIWSLFMLDCYAKSPLDLVRGEMRHDNNHLLNSLYLHALGPHLPPLLYRIPAAVAGTLALIVAGLIGRKRSPLSGWWSAAAFATSYLLVNVSSEARGYGLMALALLVAQWAALAAFESGSATAGGRPPARLAVAFNIASVCGILAHLSFAMGYLAILVWSSWRLWQAPRTWHERLRAALAWHAVPLATLVTIYWFFARGMTVGRGPQAGILTTVSSGLSALVGGPIGSPAATLTGLVVAVIVGLCLAQCWRARPDRGLFFLLSIVVAPAVVVAAFPIDFYAIRYFLVPLQTVLLLVAGEVPVFVASQRAAGRAGMAGLAVAASLIVAATNLGRDGVLIARGRGAYRDLLQAVIAASTQPGPTIIAASDSHFRHKLLIAYHGEHLAGRGIRLLDDEELPSRGAEWYFVLDTRDGMPARPEVADRHGNRYAFVGETRGGSLAAGHWQVYRNLKLLPTGREQTP
jgi:hypothetical protein